MENKLVVELAANIRLQKLWYEETTHICNFDEKHVSASKQIKILAICQLIKENEDLTEQELKAVLKKRPILFKYFRYLLKEYPNFIELAKTKMPGFFTGPYYFIDREYEKKDEKQKAKFYNLP